VTDVQALYRGLTSRMSFDPRRSSSIGMGVAGAVAGIPTLAILLVRIGKNAPAGPKVPYTAVYDPLVTAALVGPAIAAIIVSSITENDVHRVGLGFAGVFGLLSAIAVPAALSASVAIVMGTALVMAPVVLRGANERDYASLVVATLFVAGVFLSILGGLGFEAATTRRLGSFASLLAVAGSPTFVDWNVRGATVGAFAGAAVAGFGVSAPFVTGAASLIAGGIVGVSLPVQVLATVGGVTVVATGIDRKQYVPMAGGLLLLSAGVPATIPRGLAVLVGLSLILTTVKS